MKTFTALSAISGLVASANAQYFGLIAARSASPIHLQEVTASGQRLWIGRETASYCPSTVNATGSCPPGEYTEFAGGDGSLAMGVVVPGGQLVYIDAECGAVGYTQAHSAALPKGAIVDGWNKTEGPSFGYLTHENGLIACPATDSETGKPNGWQVFVQLPGLFFIETCLGFSALTSNTTQPGAWQYT